MIRQLCFLTAAISMSACVSVLPKPGPAPSVYRLGVMQDAVKPLPSATVIRVDRPSSSTYFETKDIVVSPDGRRLATAGGAEWAEVIPIMVQDALVSKMATSPNIVGVIPSSGARTNTRIHLTIKNFEAQFDQGEENAPLAVVRFDLTLSDASNRDLITTYSTRQTVRASEARVSAIVEAIERANQDALTDILAWMEEQARTNPS